MNFTAGETVTLKEIRDIWRLLDTDERVNAMEVLSRQDADAVFMGLPSAEQAAIVVALPEMQQKSYVRLLAPDDVADLVQQLPRTWRERTLELLDDRTRAEVIALLTYEEDAAGGLMNPRYVRLRPDMTAEEALFYLRRQAKESAETIYVAFVLNTSQQLLGAVSLRQVLQAKLSERISAFMEKEVLSVRADAPQEDVSRLFADHDLSVMPVLDESNRMVGIVTIDDIVDVVREEATEDIQRMAGVESLERPYPQTSYLQMMRKRAGWLTALFFSEMLTATALGHYEDEIQRAVVLSLFLTLIASAGGNSGSQSTALIVRAIALGELRLRDWWMVLRRELLNGLSLGILLGSIGFLRVVIWAKVFHMYGPYYHLLAATIGLTLVCVVLWGTISGAMLPFIVARAGQDPAVASAPFVATFVDVTAIIIYFQISKLLLNGMLL